MKSPTGFCLAKASLFCLDGRGFTKVQASKPCEPLCEPREPCEPCTKLESDVLLHKDLYNAKQE